MPSLTNQIGNQSPPKMVEIVIDIACKQICPGKFKIGIPAESERAFLVLIATITAKDQSTKGQLDQCSFYRFKSYSS